MLSLPLKPMLLLAVTSVMEFPPWCTVATVSDDADGGGDGDCDCSSAVNNGPPSMFAVEDKYNYVIKY